jgi:dimethylaniline monooxygenase (N-oxide forming)
MGGLADGTVGIIGAGGSGILAATALHRREVPFELLEARDGVGGTWRYDPEGTGSAAYESLVMNTSKLATSPRALRIPGPPWRYAKRAEMQNYMERLVDKQELRGDIRLNWRVQEARPDAGGWTLVSTDAEERSYGSIICALGSNGKPRRAEIPGDFRGEQLHSLEYRSPNRFAGRDVLVIGLGTSGAEVAGELAGVARCVRVAVRSPLWLMTRRLGGYPIDWIDNAVASQVLPWSVRRIVVRTLCQLTTGRLHRRGVPRPSRRCGDDIIGISDTFPRAVRSGALQFSDGVAEANGRTVRFYDGTEGEFDAIVHATGFDPPTDFLPDSAQPGRYNLYRRIRQVEAANLYFVGLVEAVRALLPIAEAQANWTAAVLAGDLALPSEEAQRATAHAEGQRGLKDFGDRRPFLVDWAKYKARLRRDQR